MRRAILHIVGGRPYNSALPPYGPTCVLSHEVEVIVIDTETGEKLAGIDGVRALTVDFPMDGFVTATVVIDELKLDIFAEAFIGNRAGHLIRRTWMPFVIWLRYRFLPRFRRIKWQDLRNGR